MGKKVEEPKKEEAPEWIVSFTDMTSLEMAFFICLMSFATISKDKVAEVQGSLQGAFNMMGKSQPMEPTVTFESPIQGRDPSLQNAPRQVPRFTPLEDNDTRHEIQQLRDQHGLEFDLDKIEDGYQMKVGDAISFERGSDVVPQKSYNVIGKIAEGIRHVPFRTVLVGYAGLDELKGAGEARTVDLALHRAQEVVKILVEKHGISVENIGIAGYAETGGADYHGRVELLLVEEQRFLRGGTR
jgi:chemotaxis protein MotB